MSYYSFDTSITEDAKELRDRFKKVKRSKKLLDYFINNYNTFKSLPEDLLIAIRDWHYMKDKFISKEATAECLITECYETKHEVGVLKGLPWETRKEIPNVEENRKLFELTEKDKKETLKKLIICIHADLYQIYMKSALLCLLSMTKNEMIIPIRNKKLVLESIEKIDKLTEYWKDKYKHILSKFLKKSLDEYLTNSMLDFFKNCLSSRLWDKHRIAMNNQFYHKGVHLWEEHKIPMNNTKA